MAYQGNQINYNNLNDELKVKVDKAEGVESQVSALTSKVDNSWQLGKFNDTDITNIGQTSVSRVFHIYNWEAPDSNIEQASIVIPATIFSGTVKVSVTGSYVGTNGSGAFEYETSYLKIDNNVHTYNRTIYKADDGIATQYYFPDFNRNEHLFTIPIVRRPNALNRLTVKVELLGIFEAFNMLKDAYIVHEDFGTSWHSYPWTPQTSSFVQRNQNNTIGSVNTFTAEVPFIFERDDVHSHAFHKSADGALHIAPSREVNGVGGWNWDNGLRLDPNGYGNIKGLIVDGVDLKQSVSNGKSQVANAITQKGVPTSADAEFATMANNIGQIKTGKKYARGSGTLQRVGQYLRIVVTGLDFKPSIILISRMGMPETNVMWKSIYVDGNAFMPASTSINMYTYYNSRDTSFNTVYGALAHSSYGGFEMNVASYVQGVDDTGTYTWIAFE
ncbi:hypothetical protein [Lysinibacillus pakistanensis]|uniref:hypothetical protein n=1 Tax=Lysinibacillus pakistanensis TaxID=759811 RepID=UPI003D2A8AC7